MKCIKIQSTLQIHLKLNEAKDDPNEMRDYALSVLVNCDGGSNLLTRSLNSIIKILLLLLIQIRV